MSRRPDLLAIVVALLGTLAVAAAFLGDLLLSRESELAAGERRVQEFGVMLGEHTARSFEAAAASRQRYELQLADGSWVDSREAARLAARVLPTAGAFASR